MTAPAVSVVLPTYNRAPFLPKAIGAVQAQSFSDWELVIVDDGSTDGTSEIVAEFARNDGRLRFLTNTRSQGPAGARNAGILAARGRLVAFVDSDDLWEPPKLAAFIDAMSSDRQLVLVGSDYRIAGTDDPTMTMKKFILGTMLPWWMSYPPAVAVIPCDAIVRDFGVVARSDLALSLTIAGFLWIHTSSAMVHRDALLRAGLFDERLQRTEDIDLWLKLAQLGSFGYIDRVLATYHTEGRDEAAGTRYEGQHRLRKHTPYREAKFHLELLNRIAKSYPLTPAQANLLRHRRAAYHRACLEHALRARSIHGIQHIPAVILAPEERRTFLRNLRNL